MFPSDNPNPQAPMQPVMNNPTQDAIPAELQGLEQNVPGVLHHQTQPQTKYKPPNIIPKQRVIRTEAKAPEFYNKDYEECKRKVETFWEDKRAEIRNAPKSYFTDSMNSKSALPLARLKKIMRLDTGMENQDAPIFLAKVCELFIEELTLKSFMNTEEQRRKVLQKCDLVATRLQNPHMDFLVDFLPSQGGPYPDVYGPDGRPLSSQDTARIPPCLKTTQSGLDDPAMPSTSGVYVKDGVPVQPTFPLSIDIRPIDPTSMDSSEGPSHANL